MDGFERPSCITDWLLLGDREDAADLDGLLHRGVTHVINAARQLPNSFPQHMHYLKLKLEDSRKQDIRPVFEQAFATIDHARSTGGRVLVHCVAGVSRSATLVLAYLVCRERMWLRDAIRFVRQRRYVIKPNTGFLQQLARFEVEVKGASSICRAGGPADDLWQFDGSHDLRAGLPPARIPPAPRQCWLCCCCFLWCYGREACGACSCPCPGPEHDQVPAEPEGSAARSMARWCKFVALDLSCSLENEDVDAPTEGSSDGSGSMSRQQSGAGPCGCCTSRARADRPARRSVLAARRPTPASAASQPGAGRAQ